MNQIFTEISRRKGLTLLLLFLATMLAYLPVLSGEFIWDDTFLVGSNPFFKSPIFFFEVFRHHLFLDALSGYYRPVQNWTYMLDYLLWDQNTFGYHVANVFYHALSAFLIWRLLLLLIPRLWPTLDRAWMERLALLVAFLWAVHPIHNAAVAYIAGRADSLACIFAIAGWLLVEKVRKLATAGRRGAQITCIGLAVLCGVLGLCSKEITIIWIALFVVFTFAFDPGRSWRDRFGCLAGAVVAILLCVGLRQLPPAQTSESVPTSNGDPALLALGALGDYTGLLFFPSNLHMDRSICANDHIGTNAAWIAQAHFRSLTYVGGAALLGFILLGAWKSPGQRLRIFGIVWFWVGFLPISNLFPLNAQVAEHWVYMPSVGFILLVVGSVVALKNRWRPILIGTLTCALIPLTIRTAFRADDWTSPIRFYTRTIEQGGGTARIHANLAVAYFYAGNISEAEKVLVKTVKFFPDYINARIVLGVVYAREKKIAQANENLNLDKQKADALAKEFPKTWQASLNYAKVQVATQHIDKALQALDDAIARTPEVWDLVEYKSVILKMQNQAPEGLALVKAYCDAHWWHYESWLRLGELQLDADEWDAATATFQHAALLDIHSAQPYQGVAMLEMKRNQPEKALAWQKKAVARENALPGQFIFLARIYSALHRPEDAQHAFDEARGMGDVQPQRKSSDLIF